ncbi:diacylglycerol O-acyltransferase 2-like [Oncorhynchus keta]|uniref:diacylglycerol O-acyltransferase 2-like n=1 Tax=Oncorhynchus keta TaxID=8018 RepID=UPI0015F7C3D4|nr:diacylglycerol O-acyltransferase 2-like [Oncorhynchus keta]
MPGVCTVNCHLGPSPLGRKEGGDAAWLTLPFPMMMYRHGKLKKTILAAYTCVLRGTGSVLLSALQSLLSMHWAWCPRLENQVQVFSVMQFIVSFLIIRPYMLCGDAVPPLD